MNILVVGNGFDLAHGLPTKYSDFLDFVKILDNCSKECLKREDDFYDRAKSYINSKKKQFAYHLCKNLKI